VRGGVIKDNIETFLKEACSKATKTYKPLIIYFPTSTSMNFARNIKKLPHPINFNLCAFMGVYEKSQYIIFVRL
jgi:hypothetical protein